MTVYRASASQPVPNIVLYHAECLDGFGAAWALWKQLSLCYVCACQAWAGTSRQDWIPSTLSWLIFPIQRKLYREQWLIRLLACKF